MRRANKKRFNQGNDDLHSSFRYTVPVRNHSEPVCYCRILKVCGTQDGEWIGYRVGEVLPSWTLYAGHGESLNFSPETMGLQ